MSRWWSIALLVVVVAGLAAWVYLKPPPAGPVEYPVSSLDPAAITSVLVERPGEPSITAEKKDGAWLVTAPIRARASETRIQQLLEIARARSPHRYPATDLPRFELDRPQARITLSGQAFSLGVVSEVTREQYVLAGDSVYVLSPRYGASLPVSAADLASPRLFGPGETPVRFELGAFAVVQHDGGWRLVPEAPDLSQDDFVRWVDAWRNATAARVDTHASRKPAPADVKVTLKDGREIAVNVVAREPDVTIARPDEKLQYIFKGAAARLLLLPPGGKK